MSDWQELDDLAAELRAANASWAERVDALAGEGEPLSRLTVDVERQFAELGVREALEALAQRALAGAATIYEARRPFGYARSATLAWHPSDDPRADLASDEREALLTLDVVVGPRLLLGTGEGVPADDRLAVLIMGEKRMMATLPTSREKFRSALLRAFSSPRRGALPPEAGSSAADTTPAPHEPAASPEVGAERAAAANAFAEGVAADRAGEQGAGTELRDGPATEPATTANATSAEQTAADAAADRPGNAETAADPASQADEHASAAPSEEQESAPAQQPGTDEQRPFEEPPDVIQL